jgi:hypothetical protein
MKTEKRVVDNTTYVDYENTVKNNHPEIGDVESNISIFRILKPAKQKVQLLQLMTFIVFTFPIATFAQLPNLGTAENFAMFTTIGALGSTGTSTITGDIGTNGGAISGFGAPTVVNGNIESVNSATVQCALDVQAAYDEIFAFTPTVVGHTPAFGGGETLPPGVYNIGAAGSIGGNLTLDAAGDPSAIFVFQFGGAFTTGASSTVNLINGATACNVFWIAEGAMSMAAITDMKGTLISNNGAVTMGAGGTLEGRMLTTAGEASVYDAVITALPSCSPLPISLLSFTGYCNNQNNILEWETTTETNNNYFTIERSEGGETWNLVGTVKGAGNSSSLLHYTLTDVHQNKKIIYYRLKQTDFNGNYKYEKMISVTKCKNNGADRFTIFPNPSEGKFKLLFNGDIKEINSIDIFNSQGQNIYNSIDFQSTFDLSNNAPDLYYIRIKKNSEIISLKFILSN